VGVVVVGVVVVVVVAQEVFTKVRIYVCRSYVSRGPSVLAVLLYVSNRESLDEFWLNFI
jgi:hypothetical protein